LKSLSLICQILDGHTSVHSFCQITNQTTFDLTTTL